MRLLKLEIFGFKSFARKVEINFEPGITAIIGPNGSGKSNIVDAIRWVLGEQSAKSLRGSKMEDVIFVGSEHRKPLGMAQVSLTLDNSDGALDVPYAEVCIRRRVFRSGEGEYSINGKVCRLRDLAELFMNTGLGRDDYSIIDRRKVDAVLGSKPQERRLLLEEAAGIYKYRVRREETLRKLAETEDNSLRLTDILRELEARLEPLRLDAAKAKAAEQLDEELRKLSLWLLFGQYSNWEENQGKVSFNRQEALGDLELAKESVAGTEAAQQSLAGKLEAQEEELAAVAAQQANLATSKEHQQGDLRVGRERQRALAEQKKRLSQEAEELQGEYQELSGRLAKVEAEQKKASEQQSQAQRRLTSAQEKLDSLLCEAQTASQKLESAKGELIGVLEELAGARNQRKSLEDDGKRLAIRLKRIEARQEEIQQEKAELDRIGSELEAKEQELQSDKQQTAAGLASLTQELQKVTEDQKATEDQLAETKHKREQKQARQRALAEMERHFEGYFRGTRNVLERKEQLPGLIGPVADLIGVPESLELAMETALGAGLQNIVTEDEDVAQKSIELLRKNNWGRATFLPLSLLRPDKIKELSSSPGILGIGSDLIDYDPKFAPAVEYLLGRTVVAEDLPNATKLAHKTGSRYRIVTLQGDLISPGGAVSGGSREQKGTGLLARKRELEELKGELHTLSQTVQALEDQKGQILRQLAELAEKKEQLTKVEQAQDLATVELERDHREYLAALARLARQFEAVEAEKNELLLESEQLQDKEQIIARKVAQLEDREQQLREQLSLQDEEQTRWQAQRLEYEQELAAFRVEQASLTERTAQLEAQSEDLALRLTTIQTQLDRNRHSDEALESELALLKENLAQLEQEIATSGEAHFELEEKLQQCRTRRQRLREELERVNSEVALARESLERAQSILHKHEVLLARLESEGERISGELLEKHNLTADQLSPQNVPQLELSVSDGQRKLKKLGLQRQDLGIVNFGAIEELAQVEERVHFLQSQLEDLGQARTSLLALIQEIDGTSRQMLEATFKEVNLAFGTVFAKLFQGGKAHLELCGPDGEQVDPLEAGLEVLVQLPGKKQQNIQLLSGGERAFVAIAFLFSILKVHPSPFCVLDEIDAPLDEANLERFSSLLREFVAKTQFIIITHRRRTMEEADALYGVTMQEAGISQLLSVRLKDAV